MPLLVLTGCQKELDLLQFKDDFGDYQPEVRIEAILATTAVHEQNPLYPVIVRVDRSIAIDDTALFNGNDDNGNWHSFTDVNGNGQWDPGEPLNDDVGEDGRPGQDNGFPARDKGEGNGRPDYGEPHVDEYDEILPLVHDTTATVTLTNLTDAKQYLLIWQAIAARFQYLGQAHENRLNNVYDSYYGGYVLYQGYAASPGDTNKLFEFTIDFPGRGLTVKGQTRPIPQATFIDPGFPKVRDTLYIPYGGPGGILWSSDPRATVYCVRVERVLKNIAVHLLWYEHPNVANRALTAANGGMPVGFEPITAELEPGLYHLIVTTMDENYARYYYSSLPLKDPAKSNLRDQYGHVVMGVAGSKAENAIYFRILQSGTPKSAGR